MSYNKELSEISVKGRADPSLLSPVEATMFTHHVSGVMMMWFNTYLQFQGGLIEEEFWKTCERDIVGFFKSPGVQTVWEQVHPTFTPDFVELVNSVRVQDEYQSADFFPTSLVRN